MKILFTGASSFTGYWFVKTLTEVGHEVHGTFTGNDISDYCGVRKERVHLLTSLCETEFGCSFGSTKFMDLLNDDWDVLCHHAAEVTNFKSQDFDIPIALKNNTNNISEIIKTLLNKNCNKIVLTGSVFESNEGTGSDNLKAFSPYGLSKSFTFQVFEYFSDLLTIDLAKFVIPNPFGPYEDFRFTSFLMKNWIKEDVPVVNTPAYVRDNIHVNLLALVYCKYVNEFLENNAPKKINPSGYIETQGAFTTRFAEEIRKRTNLKCNFKLKNQSDFNEPKKRINTYRCDNYIDEWDEKKAWDDLVTYYLEYFR